MQERMVILSLISLLTLTACSDSQTQQEIQKQVAAIKSKPVAPIAPLPPVQPMKRAVYQAGNLRDPFQPSKKNISENVNFSNPSQKKQPLEAFPLNSLEMVGTIKKAEQYWALIKAINGTIYPIRIGQYLGQNKGLVVNITADAVILEEKIQLNGEWQSHKIQLCLKQ